MIDLSIRIIEPCMAVMFGVIIMLVGSRLLVGMFAVDPSHEIMEKNVAFGMLAIGIYIGMGVMTGLIISAIVRG